MDSDFSTGQRPRNSLRYRVARALVRAWLGGFFRRFRVLNPEAIPEPGAVLLVVSHPPSFLDALLLIAALKRQVHCFIAPRFLRGLVRASLGWLLGMIPAELAGDAAPESINKACGALVKGEAVLLFAEEQVAKPGAEPHFTPAPSVIAMRAEAQTSGQLELEILPLHVFLPVAQLYSSEVEVHVGDPLIPREYLARGGNMSEQARVLASALEEACRQNVFRLQGAAISQFLADLEELLRAAMLESWAAQPDRKQKIEGFQLSRFIAEFVDHLNELHPGQLVSLRDQLDRYRETHRRHALDRLIVQKSGDWIQAPFRKAAGWLETVLGLPLALWGSANHLVAGIILHRLGLLARDRDKNAVARWVSRAFIVVACYAAQILLCDAWLGRIAAGYYALTLLPTGLYLWRYLWLWRHRSRPLLLELRARRQAASLLTLRDGLIQELNAARDLYADQLGLAH